MFKNRDFIHFYLQDFVDVTLACADGSTIDAHKVILSSVSTYFREILKVEQLYKPSCQG